MKRRLIAGGITLLVLWLAMVPISYNLDALLSQRFDYVWNPFRAIPLVIHNGNALKFCLMLMAICVLAIIACLTAGSNVSSHTSVQRITPDIVIPAAAGQGQFGTARFLSKKKYGKVFTVWKLPTDGRYQELIKEGKADAKKVD